MGEAGNDVIMVHTSKGSGNSVIGGSGSDVITVGYDAKVLVDVITDRKSTDKDVISIVNAKRTDCKYVYDKELDVLAVNEIYLKDISKVSNIMFGAKSHTTIMMSSISGL